MATDGPTPAPCDPQVYREGEAVFITHSIPSNSMEAWVRSVAQASGQRVDWHFMGGRAVIRALGNIDAVKRAMRDLMPDHDQRYATAIAEYGSSTLPPRPDWWLSETP